MVGLWWQPFWHYTHLIGLIKRNLHILHYTLRSTQYTLHTTHYTLHTALHTTHYTHHTTHYLQFLFLFVLNHEGQIVKEHIIEEAKHLGVLTHHHHGIES